MSGASQSEAKEPKSSRRPSPLRATVPLQAMHRTSPLRLRNRISPDTELISWDHMPTTPTKGRCGSSRGSNSNDGGGPTMRRTASLDAIYLKGQWPKDSHTFSNLTIDKYSQTPEEWASTCYGSLSVGFSACEEMGSCGRRPSASSAVCLPSPQATAPQPQHFDKFIRQRLQRTNKESGGAVRYSPVHGDHSVLAPTPIHPRHQALQTSNGNSRAVQIPQCGRSMLPRLRNSVEGLNQEIERLVLRTSHLPGDDDLDDVWSEVQCRDGRRAPIADFMRYTRSVDTQTPARTQSATSQPSSLHTSPSISPPMSPQQRSASASGISPSPPHTPKLATSPHINKFNREPPDGCERVSLKLSEDSVRGVCHVSQEEDWLTVKPAAAFTLHPSQGSAFSTLERHSIAGELSSSLPSGRMYYSPEELSAEYGEEYSGGEGEMGHGGVATAECSTSTSSLAQPCCSSDPAYDPATTEDYETTHDQ